ncbi:type 4 prepilin peptidase 1 [Agitococcus lubricus]|uniref:Prepilin leader peptidase/N-methyltransferase n=2 Tax=Agitococcus lubricus TaxID=1077255 RepID=A0A2T5J299_9GAMM|nr:A24 family peptidase [Agitococcus lubricus]PTQ90645.1 type 4 prepilin peptidase 1 [Agitococcus lubricus]
MMMLFMSANPLLAGGIIFCLGLCIGSFLNVVIYRLPVMLERAWRKDALACLNQAETETTDTFNLATPASRCPHCGHQITALENIPVFSWLFLRGQCSECHSPISIRYPLVELATGLLSVMTFIILGPTAKMLTALLLVWAVIALTMIDFDTQLLPDDITLALLWLGLLVNLFGIWVPISQAVVGAMLGYLSLWSVYWLFKLVTGKEGMGYGDFKLLAALGAWLGPTQLPLIILLSSVVGAIIGGVYAIIRKESAPFAFGPYLAIAGLIALFGGTDIIDWYLAKWQH